LKKFINRRILRFLAVGAFNTLSTYLIYLLCLTIMNYALAFSITTVVGIFIAYVANAKFVFQVPLSWREMMKYPIVYIAQYLIGLTLLVLEVRLLGMNEKLAPLMNVALMIPLTYAMNKLVLVHWRRND
jgi:putative flippase GtrA